MRERVRSGLIILLLISALALFYSSVTLDLDSQEPFDWLLSGGLFRRTETAAGGGERRLSLAVLPERLGLARSGQLYLCTSAQEFELMWEESKLLFFEAVGSMRQPEEISREQYLRALDDELLFISFHRSYPFYLFRAWADREAGPWSMEADTLIVHAKSGQVYLSFQDVNTGKWYSGPTAAAVERFDHLSLTRSNAFFAGWRGEYPQFMPDEPILIETLQEKVYTVADPDFALTQEVPREILATYTLNPSLAKVYEDHEGGIVYVEDFKQLRMDARGALSFSIRSGQPGEQGIPLALSAGADQNTRTAQTIDRARLLVEALWDEADAGGAPSFSSFAVSEDGGLELYFEVRLNHRFLTGEGSTAAYVRTSGDYIVEAVLYPREYTEERTIGMLSYPLAAAALSNTREARIWPVYWAEGENSLAPRLSLIHQKKPTPEEGGDGMEPSQDELNRFSANRQYHPGLRNRITGPGTEPGR